MSFRGPRAHGDRPKKAGVRRRWFYDRRTTAGIPGFPGSDGPPQGPEIGRRCLDIACHSERSEEVRRGLGPVIRPTQSEILRSAQNDKQRGQDDSEGLGMTLLGDFFTTSQRWISRAPEI